MITTKYQALNKYLQAMFNDLDRSLSFNLHPEDICRVLEALLEKHKEECR